MNTELPPVTAAEIEAIRTDHSKWSSMHYMQHDADGVPHCRCSRNWPCEYAQIQTLLRAIAERDARLHALRDVHALMHDNVRLNEQIAEQRETINALRSEIGEYEKQVAAVTAQRDAIKRTREQEQAWSDVLHDLQVAQEQLAAVTTERDATIKQQDGQLEREQEQARRYRNESVRLASERDALKQSCASLSDDMSQWHSMLTQVRKDRPEVEEIRKARSEGGLNDYTVYDSLDILLSAITDLERQQAAWINARDIWQLESIQLKAALIAQQKWARDEIDGIKASLRDQTQSRIAAERRARDLEKWKESTEVRWADLPGATADLIAAAPIGMRSLMQQWIEALAARDDQISKLRTFVEALAEGDDSVGKAARSRLRTLGEPDAKQFLDIPDFLREKE